MSLTERTPIATIEAFEAAAFRVSHVVRRLLAEHPALPLKEIRPSSHAYGTAPTARIEVDPGDVDAVRAWATALGAEVQMKVYDATAGCRAFEYHKATVEMDGVEVDIACTRSMPDDQAQARDTRQNKAAAQEPAGESGGVQ